MSLETEIINFLQEPERKERMMKAAEDALHAKVTEQFRWNLPDAVSKACSEFVETEVAPKAREHLMKNKGRSSQQSRKPLTRSEKSLRSRWSKGRKRTWKATLLAGMFK